MGRRLPGNQHSEHAETAHLRSHFLESLGGILGEEQRDSSESVQRRHRQQVEDAQQQVQREHDAQKLSGALGRAGLQSSGQRGEVSRVGSLEQANPDADVD
jgi:hypothetical protein